MRKFITGQKIVGLPWKTNKELSRRENCPLTSDQDVEFFRPLFSDEGDEQKQKKILLYTADVPTRHGKGIADMDT